MRRRLLMLALATAGLFAGWVASAAADLPNLPPVPPVQVPTLPVLPPPPRVPQVPPVSVPKIPAAPPVSHPSLPGRVGTQAGPSQSTSGGTQGSATQAGAGSAGPTKVYRVHFSRDWIARSGPRGHRETILSFVLRKPSLVEFVVFQISPECRRLGRFRVQGQPGLNRIRFRGRIGRRVLGPGTYRIRARALGTRRSVIEKRLVIVSRVNKEDIAAARGADACASGATEDTGSNASTAGAAGTGGGSSHQASAGASASSKAAGKHQPARAHGVLGARFTKKAVDAVKGIPLWLFVLLGLAIALLTLAALPLRIAPTGRSAGVLAHRRGLIALAGAAVLVTVTVAYVLR